MVGVLLEILEIVKPSRNQNGFNFLLTELLCLTRPGWSQTRSLICLSHPRCFIMYARFDLRSFFGSLEADFSMLIPQLRRVWAKDAFLKNHVLVNIVRLTVETNLATSKDFRGVDVMYALPLSHARSASVSIVSLIMIAAYPVSGPANFCFKCISVEIDRRTLA